MSTVTMPRSTLFLETVHTTAIAIRRPTLLERIAAVLWHASSFVAGKLLAQSNELRAIARRGELEAQAAADIAIDRARCSVMAQPTMGFDGRPRAQPRSGNGRFLPKRWLRDAETFGAADLAWFRSPVGAVRS